jgi:hypothetical protein
MNDTSPTSTTGHASSNSNALASVAARTDANGPPGTGGPAQAASLGIDQGRQTRTADGGPGAARIIGPQSSYWLLRRLLTESAATKTQSIAHPKAPMTLSILGR